MRQTKFITNNTNLIFEKDSDRLYQFKIHILRKSACIMMSLDSFLRLKNIRPDRTLCQELNSFQFSCFFSKYFNEFSADNFSLRLRIFHSCQFIQETIGCIHINKIRIHLVTEHFYYLLRLAFTKQTMIYMNTYQLLTNCLD